jgi:hypothetical protein
MKTILLTLLLISSVSFSQTFEINNIQDALTLKNDIGDKYSPYNPDIKGTPFVHSEYQNITIKGVAMKGKYNAHQDYMEIDTNGKIGFFVPAVEFRFDVIFTDLNATYRAFEFESLKFGFFRVLAHKDDSYILSREYIKLNPEVKPKSNFDSHKPAKFQNKSDTYYIKFSGKDVVVELPTSKNNFYSVFGNHEDAIKSFIKKQKLSIDEENDLVKIFTFYNTLQ